VTDQGFEALAGLTALRELDVSCWTVRKIYCCLCLPGVVKLAALAAIVDNVCTCSVVVVVLLLGT
jgi:hypothetical protein